MTDWRYFSPNGTSRLLSADRMEIRGMSGALVFENLDGNLDRVPVFYVAGGFWTKAFKVDEDDE